jgi:hypothetical protein
VHGIPQAEVCKVLNEQTLLMAMIETPEAVENADAIAAVDGIDVLHIGASDLSTEMGIPGQYTHELFGGRNRDRSSQTPRWRLAVGDMRPVRRLCRFRSGTSGSNPLSSSGESNAKLTPGGWGERMTSQAARGNRHERYGNRRAA